MIPPLAPLLRVTRALEAAGIAVALGGSGLLYSLGLIDQVRDWDLTTDAPFDDVSAALAGLGVGTAPFGDGLYRTAARISYESEGASVDLMGSFAFETPTGVCRIPTVVAGRWQDVPTGSPEVWAVAYRLMERHPKADLLSQYVRRHGASVETVEMLLWNPLPPEVRQEVLSWPV